MKPTFNRPNSFMIRYTKHFKACIVSSLPCSYTVLAKLRMSSSSVDQKEQVTTLKRGLTEVNDSDEISPKKATTEEKIERVKKRKVALLLAYLGQGYLGLQRNPGTKTIEEDLLVALLKCGYINDEVFKQPQVIQFQRAARTDKGVSALRQVLSMKLPENTCTEAINKNLPEQIRAIAMQRVTKGFNCKSSCDGRTYSYMCPTFAFSPSGQEYSEDYRLSSQVRERVSQVLKMYEGTHNFHNFTSKRMPSDPSVNRFMMSFTCGQPFIVDGLEFVILKVKGQSFMLHQIRKMVGLVIAIVQGLTTTDTLTRAWERDKLDIPIAPGLGLLLEEVHYDRYNKRYGNDGMHEAIDWSKWDSDIDDFKRKFILPTIVETEKNEKSMLLWLETLNMHSFDIRLQHIHTDLDKALEKQGNLLSPRSPTDPLQAIEAT